MKNQTKYPLSITPVTGNGLRRGQPTLNLLLALALLATGSGCATESGARNAATAAGAATGAVVGLLKGGRRNGLAGALAGAAVGATLARQYGSGLFKSGELKFQEAVLKGDTAGAARHVDARFVNTSINGFPPLYYAAVHGDTEMVNLLVQHGASVHVHPGGKSLAYHAAAFGFTHTGERLVSLGGGNSSDVSAGKTQYAIQSEQQRRQARLATAAALAMITMALQSSASSGDDYWDGAHGAEHRYYDGIGGAMHDTNMQLFGPLMRR